MRTICTAQYCVVGCGIYAHVHDGQVTRITGDREHPRNRGKICVKGGAFPELQNSRDRLLYSLKRRGEGFARVSWDEALDEIALTFNQIIADHGPEAVAVVIDGLGMQLSAILLGRAFGNPNVMDILDYCEGPANIADGVTFGEPITSYASDTRTGIMPGVTDCVVHWGANPFVTNLHIRQRTLECLETEATLIAVDPVYTRSAQKADLWLPIRPGTDAALALGMINVIVQEGLEDRGFVEEYCSGFDELAERARQYPVEKVAIITDVPAEKIHEAAVRYATADAAYLHSRIGYMQQSNATQTARAVACLIAITGNVEKPGTNLLSRNHGILTMAEMVSSEEWRLPSDVENRMIGRDKYPLHSVYNLLSPSVEMLNAMSEGRIKAAFVAGTNPVLAYPDARRVVKAFRQLECMVVVDMFMTPTAELAHFVLPTTTFLEREEIADDEVTSHVSMRRRVVDPPGECRDDWEICHDLAHRMGVGDRYFSWSTKSELDAFRLGRAGLSLDDLNRESVLHFPVRYGFDSGDISLKTPTGKIELYSTVLEEHGWDPLPYYEAQDDRGYADEYPLTLIVRRVLQFQNSGGRFSPTLTGQCPVPECEVHPNLAEAQGIEEGDLVRIATPFGEIHQHVKFNQKIRPTVVAAQVAAWSPEAVDVETRYFEANVNALTSQSQWRDPISGSPALRNIPCKIGRVDQEHGVASAVTRG